MSTATDTAALAAPITFNLPLPTAEELDREVEIARNFADFLQIDNQEDLDRASDEMNAYAARVKELEAARKSLTKPIDDAKKRVMDRFRPAIDGLNEVVRTAKTSIAAYVEAEERKAAEARARAEAEAAAQRAELERQAAEARARAEAAEARQPEGAAPSAEATNAQIEAETLEEAAALVVAAPAVEAPAKPKGASIRKVWKAKVVDLPAFIKYAAEHPEVHGCISVSEAALAKYIGATDGVITLPGVEAHQEASVAARKR